MYPKKANGKLRICLDPKDLNKAIIHENHKAPTLKEIAHVLMGATKFSKVDGNKAFFGMHLTEEALLLTTFNTHLKLTLKLTPFGIAHHSKGLPFQVCLTVSTVLKLCI